MWLQRQRWEDDMVQDIRYGVRMLIKTPGLRASPCDAGVGRGANAAIFASSTRSAAAARRRHHPASLQIGRQYATSRLSDSSCGLPRLSADEHRDVRCPTPRVSFSQLRRRTERSRRDVRELLRRPRRGKCRPIDDAGRRRRRPAECRGRGELPPLATAVCRQCARHRIDGQARRAPVRGDRCRRADVCRHASRRAARRLAAD